MREVVHRVKVLNHLCAVSLEALNREAELYVNHIHEDKEKEEETIIVHNPSWHSAFAGDCSIRWPYLSVGSGLLSPATRLRQIRPDNVVLRCRAVLTRRYKAIFHRGGFANPYRTEVSLSIIVGLFARIYCSRLLAANAPM